MNGHIVFPGVWIPGTPRGYGNRKIEDQWLGSMRVALGSPSRLALARYGLKMRFTVWPESPAYRGHAKPHGPDLDNMIKVAVDGLTPHRGRGVGLIEDDPLVYAIEASKEIVTSDRETGLVLTVYALD